MILLEAKTQMAQMPKFDESPAGLVERFTYSQLLIDFMESYWKLRDKLSNTIFFSNKFLKKPQSFAHYIKARVDSICIQNP